MSILSFQILIFSTSFVNGVIYNVSTAFDVELRGAFPANAFNSSCVSSSCPDLNSSSLCSTSGYDLNATISALISSAQSSSICGLKMEPRPITLVPFSLAQLLQGVPLSGVSIGDSNCVYTNVIPNFDVISGADEAVALSWPNLALVGNFSCNLSQSLTTSLGLPLPSITLPAANVAFHYDFNYSSMMEINNGDNSVEMNEPVLVVTGVSFEGLQFPALPGIPDYLTVFQALLSNILGQIGLGTFLGDFYQNLVESALQVAANNCVR